MDGLSFVTISRRSRIWLNVPAGEQPAMFLRQVREEAMYDGRGVPIKWNMYVDVPIYVTAGPEPDASADPLLNAAIDKIERLLPFVGTKVQTLGLPGISEVRIFGNVEYFENNQTGQGIAVVPIRIVAT